MNLLETSVVGCRCGLPATANGRECPGCFRDRLASIRLGEGATETRTKVDNYDTQAVTETFGEDAADRYWDDTRGIGALHRVGDHYEHTDWHGEHHVVGEDVAAAFVQAPDLEENA